MRVLAAAAALALALATPQARATGALEGRVTFEGTPPPPTIVVEGGSTQYLLYLDKAGGLQHAVVFLADATATNPARPRPATVNQFSFIFEPQVLAVRAGQPVRFTNDDPAHHNVRSRDGNPANAFYFDTGAGVRPAPTHRFAPTPIDSPVELSCDIHPWMAAWIYAFDRGAFTTTDASGRFRIDNIPPGRHRLAIRHPAGLKRDLVVTIRSGETTRQNVRFGDSDIAPRRQSSIFNPQ
jgi:plastocyanin